MKEANKAFIPLATAKRGNTTYFGEVVSYVPRVVIALKSCSPTLAFTCQSQILCHILAYVLMLYSDLQR